MEAGPKDLAWFIVTSDTLRHVVAPFHPMAQLPVTL